MSKKQLLFVYIALVVLGSCLWLVQLLGGFSKLNYFNIQPELLNDIILSVRLPRLVNGFLSGALLAVSGLLLQTYFGNPMAGPFVLGISSGSSLGVALYLLTPLGNLGWKTYCSIIGLIGSLYYTTPFIT